MKCLFDNNMPPKLAKALNFLENDNEIRIEHLKEKFPANTPDIEWIEKLKDEGGWFVVTQDNQIRKRSHERKAWENSNIPIVFLQRSWVGPGFWEITWRFIRHWPDLKKIIINNRNAKSFDLPIRGKIKVID